MLVCRSIKQWLHHAQVVVSWLPLVFIPTIAAGDEPPDFATEIRPIFAAHCIGCHGPTKQSSDFRLDRKESVLRGGDFGEPAIVAGNASASPLFAYISEPAHANAMPPPGEGRQRLSDSEMESIRRWIDAGAEWVEVQSDASTASTHWSLQPLRREFEHGTIDAFLNASLQAADVPVAPTAEPYAVVRRLHYGLIGLPPDPTRVQQFVKDWARDSEMAVSQLVEELLASPQYGERWARHWLDVVRFAESDGFEMNHPRPNAWHYRDYVIESFNSDLPYDRFVREQLAGDRWGVDRATGFLVGGPWDQVKSPDPVLTANQRADELHDMVSVTSSAFLGLTVGCARCHAHKFDPITQVDYYRIKACLSGVQHGERELRGTDFKEQDEAAEAVREELAMVHRQLRELQPIASPTTGSDKQEGVDAKSLVRGMRAQVTHRENFDRFQPVNARFVRFQIFESTGGEPCLDELEVFSSSGANVAREATLASTGDFANNPLHQLSHVHDGRYGNEYSWISNQEGRGQLDLDLGKSIEIDCVVWSRDRSPEPKYSDRVATQYKISVSLDGSEWTRVADDSDRRPHGESPGASDTEGRLSSEQVMRLRQLGEHQKDLERRLKLLSEKPRVYGGKLGMPEPVFRFHRGDPMLPKEAVAPGALEALSGFQLPNDTSDLDRRTALADWIASPANPLTARVLVNRLWHYHFGCGLVDTPSDFGAGGGRPSHPELLDWLAVQLINNQWSIKSVQRLICNSEAYRRSSLSQSRGMERDSTNRLLWRFSPHRIEAESLRDSILSVSGDMDLSMGGPGFDLFEPNENYVRVFETKQHYTAAEFRRMVYQRKPRVELDQLFGVFDCPDAGQIQPRRNVSTTPLQALNLLNSAFILDQSEHLASRLRREAGEASIDQIALAFWLVFSRPVTDAELVISERLIADHGLEALCRALFNANEFIMVY